MPFEALDCQPSEVLDLSTASKVISELDGVISLQEIVPAESAQERTNPTSEVQKAEVHRGELRARNEGVLKIKFAKESRTEPLTRHV